MCWYASEGVMMNVRESLSVGSLLLCSVGRSAARVCAAETRLQLAVGVGEERRQQQHGTNRRQSPRAAATLPATRGGQCSPSGADCQSACSRRAVAADTSQQQQFIAELRPTGCSGSLAPPCPPDSAVDRTRFGASSHGAAARVCATVRAGGVG